MKGAKRTSDVRKIPSEKNGKYSVSRLEDDSRLLQSVLRLQAHGKTSGSSVKIKGIAGLYPHTQPTKP